MLYICISAGRGFLAVAFTGVILAFQAYRADVAGDEDCVKDCAGRLR